MPQEGILQYHPLSRPPGAVIGRTKAGRIVRFIGGGSEPQPPAPANGNGGTDRPPAPQAPPQPSPEPPAPPAPGAPAANADPAAGQGQPPHQGGGQQPGTVDDLPQWAQRLIRDTRSEAAAGRTRLKELSDAQAAAEAARQRQMDGVAQALGLKPEEVTPEKLAAERDAAHAERDAERARARAAQVELAAYRAAAAAGADPARLLDSRAFVVTLEGLDPSADGFAQLVQDKVTAAIEQNPSWKLAPAPVPGGQPAPPAAGAQPPPLGTPAIPASGPQGSFTPPPPGPRQLTEADSRQMSPQQVVKAMNDGLFREAGFGPSRKQQR